MWWWRRRQADRELLSSLLEIERARMDARVRIETMRDEIELKKAELELSHIEQRTHAEIELQEAKEKLRKDRRESSRKARERLAERRAAMGPTALGFLPNGNCRVCLNGSDPSLSAGEIQWHHAGHPAQAGLFQ